MEWLREYDKTRRSNWMFVSLDGGKLYLKDELSFAVLYARCRIDGLSVKSEKVTDAAAFDFSDLLPNAPAPAGTPVWAEENIERDMRRFGF